MITWKGKAGYLGKYQAFTVYLFYSEQIREKKYSLISSLPGLKPKLEQFKTQKDAKDKAQKALQFWLNNAGLQEIKQNTEKERILKLLEGIDKTETESSSGWWETSAGADFGKDILRKIKESDSQGGDDETTN